jgi:hypothetical protein
MKRCFYRLENYPHALHLIACHFHEQRIRAGLCFAPGCRHHGIVWLDQVGILCWDHYAEQMQGGQGT